jgi:hypothetical protein
MKALNPKDVVISIDCSRYDGAAVWHVMLGYGERESNIVLQSFDSLPDARSFASRIQLAKRVVLRRRKRS